MEVSPEYSSAIGKPWTFAFRRKTLFGETPNATREDAYAPQTLRRRQHFGNFPRGPRYLFSSWLVGENGRAARLLDQLADAFFRLQPGLRKKIGFGERPARLILQRAKGLLRDPRS